MLSSMSFEAINPTVADPVAELFFLPVKNMLQGIKKKTTVRTRLFQGIMHQYILGENYVP